MACDLSELYPPPTSIRGIPSYAPERSGGRGEYPIDAFRKLVQAELSHPWFLVRARVLSGLWRKYVSQEKGRFLEIGCGTGGVLYSLSKAFPQWEFWGGELHVEGLVHAQQRLPNSRFVQLDASQMPFQEEFDAVGLFDVIEHIEDDVGVLQGAARALKPGGLMLVSVPQHPWLWSGYDVAADHKRRYTRKTLRTAVQQAGLDLLHMTSFASFSLPIMWVSRFFQSTERPQEEALERAYRELELGGWQKHLLNLLLQMDYMLIRAGLSLPAGGSLILAARKPDDSIHA